VAWSKTSTDVEDVYSSELDKIASIKTSIVHQTNVGFASDEPWFHPQGNIGNIGKLLSKLKILESGVQTLLDIKLNFADEFNALDHTLIESMIERTNEFLTRDNHPMVVGWNTFLWYSLKRRHNVSPIFYAFQDLMSTCDEKWDKELVKLDKFAKYRREVKREENKKGV